MKRSSKLMRVSGVLLVLTMVTSTFVGGTFAKYTTADDGQDTARVAKWGVTVKVENGKAFLTNYEKDVNEGTLTGDSVISAELQEKIKVVAPGTKWSFGGYEDDNSYSGKALPALTISGVPEVAVNVNVDAEVSIEGNWLKYGTESYSDQNFYCPLVFKVQSGDKIQTICGLSFENSGGKSAFQSAIAGAIENTISGDYAPLETLNDLELIITWEWPFDNSGHADHSSSTNIGPFYATNTTEHDDDQRDENDTYLGSLAAGYENQPKITIDIETTVTQID